MTRHAQPAPDASSAGHPDASAAIRAATRQAARTILSPLGVMGIVAAPLFLAALYMNSAIIGDRLELVFRVPALPIFAVQVFSVGREITNYDMVGLLVSLLQASSATIFLTVVQQQHDSIAAHIDPVNVWLSRISAAALLLLVLFEVGVNVWGGILAREEPIAPPVELLQAVGGAATVGVLGAVCVHFFWLPLLRLLAGGGLLAVGSLARAGRRAV